MHFTRKLDLVLNILWAIVANLEQVFQETLETLYVCDLPKNLFEAATK